MNNKGWAVIRPKSYERALDRLSKKHPGIYVPGVLQSLCQVIRNFAETGLPVGDKRFGELLQGFEGKEVYKVRIPIGGTGKSGGLRFIYYLARERCSIVCLTVYEKPDKKDLAPGEKKELKKKLIAILEEIEP